MENILYFSLQFTFLSIFGCIRVVKTVVPDYCLEPLNRDDCGAKPLAVMTYWKSGSRCEIDVWRGCPTKNKFADEYECTMHCIFKINLNDEPEDACKAVFNEDVCGNITETVYSFEGGECVEKTWKGCETLNKFDDQKSCEDTCIAAPEGKRLSGMNLVDLGRITAMLDSLAPTTEVTTESTITPNTEKEEHEEVIFI